VRSWINDQPNVFAIHIISSGEFSTSFLTYLYIDIFTCPFLYDQVLVLGIRGPYLLYLSREFFPKFLVEAFDYALHDVLIHMQYLQAIYMPHYCSLLPFIVLLA